MLRTYLSVVGTVVFLFAGVAFLPHPRAMAQKSPPPTPVGIYSSASSGFDGASTTASDWSYTITLSGSPLDVGTEPTDPPGPYPPGSQYYFGSCEATTVNGGASYSATGTLIVTNNGPATEYASFACVPSISGYNYTTSGPHVASSSVTVAAYTLSNSTSVSPPSYNQSDDSYENIPYTLPSMGRVTTDGEFSWSGSAS